MSNELKLLTERWWLLVVAVAVRHGEDVAVEDSKLGVKRQDDVFALVVLSAAAVRARKNPCKSLNKSDRLNVLHFLIRWS